MDECKTAPVVVDVLSVGQQCRRKQAAAADQLASFAVGL